MHAPVGVRNYTYMRLAAPVGCGHRVCGPLADVFAPAAAMAQPVSVYYHLLTDQLKPVSLDGSQTIQMTAEVNRLDVISRCRPARWCWCCNRVAHPESGLRETSMARGSALA